MVSPSVFRTGLVGCRLRNSRRSRSEHEHPVSPNPTSTRRTIYRRSKVVAPRVWTTRTRFRGQSPRRRVSAPSFSMQKWWRGWPGTNVSVVRESSTPTSGLAATPAVLSWTFQFPHSIPVRVSIHSYAPAFCSTSRSLKIGENESRVRGCSSVPGTGFRSMYGGVSGVKVRCSVPVPASKANSRSLTATSHPMQVHPFACWSGCVPLLSWRTTNSDSAGTDVGSLHPGFRRAFCIRSSRNRSVACHR